MYIYMEIGFTYIGSLKNEGSSSKAFDENDYYVSANAAPWQNSKTDCQNLLNGSC